MIEVEEICDVLELKKRIDDLDVLLMILYGRWNCKCWWDWFRYYYSDELWWEYVNEFVYLLNGERYIYKI